MGICYIVGAGDFNEGFSPSADDLVIAADGGYDHLKKFGIRCDILLGDLDSIKSRPTDVKTIKHPVRKDETDMHLAYLEGARLGYKNFLIYGGTGGREDHTFANYCLLLYIREHGGRATLVSDKARVTVIKDEGISIAGTPGKHLSLFPFGCVAEGITVRGGEYECVDIKLLPSYPLTVSNIFKNTPVYIEVRSGALLVMGEI
jgi:thiamine pyrophosphokinase